MGGSLSIFLYQSMSLSLSFSLSSSLTHSKINKSIFKEKIKLRKTKYFMYVRLISWRDFMEERVFRFDSIKSRETMLDFELRRAALMDQSRNFGRVVQIYSM